MPSRDEALERAYDFIRALKSGDESLAGKLVEIKDMIYFKKVLHDALLNFLDMVIEDDDWYKLENRNLVNEIDDPADIDEEMSLPEFTGKQITMAEEEQLSFKIGSFDFITPVRLHFAIVKKSDTPAYGLKLIRITAKDETPGLRQSAN